jgi:transcriptional regulator with XRE-family HTH domain
MKGSYTNMKSATPRPVARAQRDIAANLSLARRQQRVSVAVLADRTAVSAPTISKLLNRGEGTLETFLRVAMTLGLLDGVVDATDPLATPLGRILTEEDVPQRVRY